MAGTRLLGRPGARPTVRVAAAAGAVAVDLSAGPAHDLTATGNVVLSLVNPPGPGVEERHRLILRQDAVGGRSWTFPGTVAWDGGVAPVINTGANTSTIIDLETLDGGVSYLARRTWASAPSAPTTETLNYTSGAQTVTVPAGRTSLTYDLRGASGAFAGSGVPGLGGRLQGTIAVTPGEVLQVNVGGAGATSGAATTHIAGGFNGGGAGPVSGGGATDIRRAPHALVDRIAVAGGGGGSGVSATTVADGAGGGGGYWGGGGGGGYNGGGTNVAAQAGGSGVGGNGAHNTGSAAGAWGTGIPPAGGAGGGLNGAAGGANGVGAAGGGTQVAGGAAGPSSPSVQPHSGGGAGGSSWTGAGTTAITHSQGANSGNGLAVLTWSTA